MAIKLRGSNLEKGKILQGGGWASKLGSDVVHLPNFDTDYDPAKVLSSAPQTPGDFGIKFRELHTVLTSHGRMWWGYGTSGRMESSPLGFKFKSWARSGGGDKHAAELQIFVFMSVLSGTAS